MNDVVVAVESSEIDLDNSTSVYSTQFCRFWLNDNHKTSRGLLV